MPDEILKAFLRIGILVGGCGFVMVFLQPRNSPEFVLSACSAVIGLTLITAVVVVSRFLKRQAHD